MAFDFALTDLAEYHIRIFALKIIQFVHGRNQAYQRIVSVPHLKGAAAGPSHCLQLLVRTLHPSRTT